MAGFVGIRSVCSAGSRTCSTKTRNTSVGVAAATVMAATKRQRGEKGQSFPGPARPPAEGALTAWPTRIGRRQRRVYAALVKQHKPRRVDARAHVSVPRHPRRSDVGALLLAGVQRLFDVEDRAGPVPGRPQPD
jgi:hypothetical protein